MTEAVAKAAGVPVADVRRAAMLAGDLAVVAEAAMRDGSDGLARFRLTPLRPSARCSPRPRATSLPRWSAWSCRTSSGSSTARASRRIAHGDDVAVFTRNLADITDRVPEIVSVIRAFDVSAVVLDGEAIALREDGRPEPFQVTMSRFGTKDRARQATPLAVLFFDCLHMDGDDLIDLPARERLARAGCAASRRASCRASRRAIERRRRRSSTTRSRAATRASW